jgi:hypothetical protein
MFISQRLKNFNSRIRQYRKRQWICQFGRLSDFIKNKEIKRLYLPSRCLFFGVPKKDQKQPPLKLQVETPRLRVRIPFVAATNFRSD